MNPFIPILSGFLSSLFATLLTTFSGGGISLILLPLLLVISPGSYTASFAVTKIGAAFSTLVAGKMHSKRQLLDKKLIVIVTLASLIGTAIGTYLLQYHFQEDFLKKMIGLSLILTALYLVFFEKKYQKSIKVQVSAPLLFLTAIFTIVLNIFNGLFGGMGIFLTAYAVLVLRMTFVEAIAHLMISFLIINFLQAGYLLFITSIDVFLLFGVIFGSLLGSWLGTHLLYLKGNQWVKTGSTIMMAIIGLNMIFKFI